MANSNYKAIIKQLSTQHTHTYAYSTPFVFKPMLTKAVGKPRQLSDAIVLSYNKNQKNQSQKKVSNVFGIKNRKALSKQKILERAHKLGLNSPSPKPKARLLNEEELIKRLSAGPSPFLTTPRP